MATLEAVKTAIGMIGTPDAVVQPWYDETVDFLKRAGVAESRITVGIIARGVLDLYNFGAGDGKLSEYFIQRAAQLALQ